MAAMGPRVLAGRYRLVQELGRGGMGVVWLADDELIGRQVAIKELRAPAYLPPEDRELVARRALAEGRNAARVRHPNAVTLHDVIPATADDDAVYLIMELVQAPNLAQIVAAEGPLSESRVTSIALQLLDVLDAAHSLGVVHRDVKPSNIIIEAGDTVKLADFGIAHAETDTRLTQAGVIGTQAYMAPELFRGADIRPPVDLWSVGATLFYAAEGFGPFDRDTTVATLNAVLLAEIPRPVCRRPLADAINALLVRDPELRATSGQAAEMLRGSGVSTWPWQPDTAVHRAAATGAHRRVADAIPATLREESSGVVMARVVSDDAARPTPPWEEEPPAAPAPAPRSKPGLGSRLRHPGVMTPMILLASAAFAVTMWWITSHAAQSSAGDPPAGAGNTASASASASLANGDKLGFAELALGQCVNNVYDQNAAGVDTPTLADCAQPHDAEVIAVSPLASLADGTNGVALLTCHMDVSQLFPDDTIPASYDDRLAIPTATEWNAGAHQAVCMIVGADHAQISDEFTPVSPSH